MEKIGVITMKLINLLSPSFVFINQSLSSKEEIFQFCAKKMLGEKIITDVNHVVTGLHAREKEGNTNIVPTCAIPHIKSTYISKPNLCIVTLNKPIRWLNEEDNSHELVKNIILLAIPEEQKGDFHIDMLAELSLLLSNDKQVETLFGVSTPQEFIQQAKQILEQQSTTSTPVIDNKFPKIVGITSCPAGIAHTYMAAESLIRNSNELGYSIKIEKQGSMGVEDELTEEEIKNAEVVVIAVNAKVDLTRFDGKRLFETTATKAIKDAKSVIRQAYANANLHKSNIRIQIGNSTKGDSIVSHIMNGISFMVPMAIAAGLLLAIANIFAFQRNELGQIVNWGFDMNTQLGYFMGKLFRVGQIGLLLMIPLFAGFMANSIAGKPAMAPAMIGAYIANDASYLDTKSGGGFLAAILVACIVGYFVRWLSSISWPKIFKPLLGIMIFPLLATLMIMIVVTYLLGTPIAVTMNSLYTGLTHLSNTYAAFPIVIGAILGGMIGFDFGGPINKTALIFAGAVSADTIAQYGIQGANLVPSTAVQAAISIAPLGVWLSALLFKNKFTEEEKIMASSAFGMGIVGVSEGALPFVATHPLQMIVASTIGSAVSGALVILTGCVFYGGIGSPLGTIIGYIVQPVPIVTWVGCTSVGILVTACIIGFWRKPVAANQ